MTRFARASGSKSSNQRVPDEATPWTVLKQQAEATNEDENETIEEQNDWKSNINQEKKEQNVNSVWCDFDEVKGSTTISEVNKKTCEKSPEVEKNEDRSVLNERKRLTKSEKRQCFACQERGHTRSECPKVQKEKDEGESDNKESKKQCFCCHKHGHIFSQCPEVEKKGVDIGVLCYKCGKEGHSRIECTAKGGNPFKFAVCLNCKKVGHIAKKCFKKAAFINTTKNMPNLKRKGGNRDSVRDNVININGQEVTITSYDGFPIKEDDAERIEQLKQDLISKGVTQEEINGVVKRERRNAEKSLSRMKKKVCFHCREGGHNLSSCPNLDNNGVDMIGSGICYKCGSTEHSHLDCRVVSSKSSFKFAVCFICKEEGHIAKQCPDNPRGLYPKGGGCNMCGDVTHFKKDCPQQQETSTKVNIGTIQDGELEALEDDTVVKKLPGSQESLKKKKIVKFN